MIVTVMWDVRHVLLYYTSNSVTDNHNDLLQTSTSHYVSVTPVLLKPYTDESIYDRFIGTDRD